MAHYQYMQHVLICLRLCYICGLAGATVTGHKGKFLLQTVCTVTYFLQNNVGLLTMNHLNKTSDVKTTFLDVLLFTISCCQPCNAVTASSDLYDVLKYTILKLNAV